MSPGPEQLSDLLSVAAGDELPRCGVEHAGHRADSAVAKKGNDFATEVDLAIERRVVAELTKLTGIGVHG
ncbi:inositol monophosphatase, partial [Mycobacterium sp. ITM-2017-0098]